MPRRVIIVSNDIVPGMSLPVAAPGLRAFGLAQGLRSHGFAVTTVVMRGPVANQWSGRVPPPLPPDTVLLQGPELGDFIAVNAPATVLLINSNQIDQVRPVEGISYVVDFFAPKMLELACNVNREDRESALAELSSRKLRAIAAADGFIVNGPKKLPYFLAWLLQGGKDPEATPLEHVWMGVPAHFGKRERSKRVRFAVAGYLQGWSLPGAWLDHLVGRLDPRRVTLDVLLPVHWGQHGREELRSERLEAIRNHEAVTTHGTMRFSEFLDFMSTIDVAVDLFDYTLEREYAVVTRSVVALACGVPVVHPPFTEVAPLIEEFDAGWLVDPGDLNAVDAVLDEITGDRAVVDRKAGNARRLWAERFDPKVATRPLAEMIRGAVQP